MKFENTQVFNFEGAFRGMRNPLNSWAKSDSKFGIIDDYNTALLNVADTYITITKEQAEESKEMLDQIVEQENKYCEWLSKNGILREGTDNHFECAFIGKNDLDLAQRLIKGGSEHRKFLRQIMVSVDITAPLYFFKEFDTYKIGTTANSTSTMHKLASTPITLDCFEIDDFDELEIIIDETGRETTLKLMLVDGVIGILENLRQEYLETKDKKVWKELIRWLPESWLQTRTITMNYENIRTMYHQRKSHKLNEWSGCDNPELPNFCSWVKTLPYAEELILYEND